MTRNRIDTWSKRPNTAGRAGHIERRALRRLPLAAAISAILGGVPIAHATPEAEQGGLEEIVVTAQKRVENLQNVPIAIEVFDSQKLEQLNVVNLDDYVKY